MQFSRNSGEAVSCGLRGLFGLENTISSKVGKKGKRSNCPVEYEKISGTLVFLPWYSAKGWFFFAYAYAFVAFQQGISSLLYIYLYLLTVCCLSIYGLLTDYDTFLSLFDLFDSLE